MIKRVKLTVDEEEHWGWFLYGAAAADAVTEDAADKLSKIDLELIRGMEPPNYQQFGNVALNTGGEGHIARVKFHPTGWEGSDSPRVTIRTIDGGEMTLGATGTIEFLTWWAHGANVNTGGQPSWLERVTVGADVVMHIPPAVRAGPGASPTPTEPCTLGGIGLAVELHDCTQGIPHPNHTWLICDSCPDSEYCNDRIPL